jgi:hypothetical protein
MGKQRRYAVWVVGVLAGMLGCALFPGYGMGGATRIALLAEVRVPGDAILLANLLPEDVSGRVRELASGVLLGKTPQNGSARTLRGAMVADAIERAGMPARGFAIPEEIWVERAGRVLSGEEIIRSLREGLGQFSLSAEAAAVLKTVQAADIAWEAGLRVPLGDARLKVRDVGVNLAEGQARFRVTAEAEAHGVPFEVLARFTARKVVVPKTEDASKVAERAVLARAAREAQGKSRNARNSEAMEGPVLVAAGKIARLRLRSENSNILLDVKALQAGRDGETIRVRVPASGKTLEGRVTGVRELEASF